MESTIFHKLKLFFEARQNLVYTVSLAVLLLSVYVYSLLPGVGYAGDTVKFQYVGYVLGTPHWPGYPAYMLLNFLFTHLVPIASLAYRSNLMSAVFSVVACIFLFRILSEIFHHNKITSFLTSFLFGITFTLWSQSVVAEVYTLAVTFIVLTVFFLFRWRQTGLTGYFLSACAVYAFSFGAHIWMIAILPAFIWFVISTDRKLLMRPKIILAVVGLIMLGIIQYGYPIWRYYAGSPYLEIIAPDIRSYFASASQQGFRPKYFNFSFAGIIFHRVPLVCFFLVREFSFFLPVAFLGIVRIWKKDKQIAIFILLCCAGDIFIVVNYDIYDIFIYMLISYFCIAVCCGAGMQALINLNRLSRYKKTSYAVAGTFIVAIMCFNYKYVSMRDSNEKSETVKSMLNIINQNALIISTGYFTTHCLNYYLIGNRLAEKRNLHLVDQIVYPYGIFTYLKIGLPYTETRVPSQVIYPGLDVYIAMPFEPHRLMQYQSGRLFMWSFHSFLLDINDRAKKRGFRLLPDSIENIRFVKTVIKAKEVEYTLISNLKRLGLKPVEVMPYLYRVTL